MENQILKKKIKSKYIIRNIFNYIKDTYFQLKLINYSKYYLKTLDIQLINYKEKYIEKIGFDINKYLHIEPEKYEEDYLIKKYDNFLLEKKLNKKEFENIISEVIKNKEAKENNIKENSEILIDMESPLFEIISKTKIFENNYTIYISQKIIDKYKLKDYYKNYFDNLNKLNIKYSSIYYSFDDKKKINYLKELNIDYNKIKRFNLIEEGKNDEDNNNKFFETLFSIKNIKNSLIYLKINFTKGNILEPNLFEEINNFKSLRYLYIKYFKFNINFNIKLENIKILSCKNCKNISISKNIGTKLEILDLEQNKISNNINILKNVNFKKLKELLLNNNIISNIKILGRVKF